MTMTDALMVLAVVVAPLLAIQAQQFIDRWRDQKRRKTEVFKTLMATRGSPVVREHVQALNLIDIEFFQEKPVLDAWESYHDHLNANVDPADADYQNRIRTWKERADALLVDLLFEMSKVLGYNFGKPVLRKRGYTPLAHARSDFEQERC
jgi:hypothetical protein